MRLLRVPLAAAIFAALLAQPSAAQEGRPFQNAWFWGAKGGVLNWSSDWTDNAGSPMVGIDWMITRSRAGLYVSLDHSFVTTNSYVRTDNSGGDVVELSGLQRVTMAAVAYPLQTPTLHPYVGVGGSLQRVGTATLLTNITLPALRQAAADTIQSRRVTVAPMFIAGVQKRLLGFSVFAQGTGTFLQKGFFLRYEDPKRGLQWSAEGGIRYNVGSSIDRER
jgi:hypothetical protein